MLKIIITFLSYKIYCLNRFVRNIHQQPLVHSKTEINMLMVLGLNDFNIHTDEYGDQIKIMQMTDLHYGESENTDNKNDYHVKKLLGQDKPSIVAVTGDLVSGYVSKKDGFYAKSWNRFQNQLTKNENKVSNFYSFMAIGRHDHEADLKPMQIIGLEQQNYQSLTSNMVHDSTNQQFMIVDETKINVIAAIFVFDTGDTNCQETYGVCPPKLEVIHWYDRSIQQIKKIYPQIKIFTYQHVPNHETLFMSNNYNIFGTSNSDSVSCSVMDSGLFSVSAKHGVVAHFFGHDHHNDQQSKWHNVTLSQGRKTGQGGYGPAEGIQPGAKVVRLQLAKDHKRIESWDTQIRNADGTMVESDDQNEFDNRQQGKCMQSSHQMTFYFKYFVDQYHQNQKNIFYEEQVTTNKYDSNQTDKDTDSS